MNTNDGSTPDLPSPKWKIIVALSVGATLVYFALGLYSSDLIRHPPIQIGYSLFWPLLGVSMYLDIKRAHATLSWPSRPRLYTIAGAIPGLNGFFGGFYLLNRRRIAQGKDPVTQSIDSENLLSRFYYGFGLYLALFIPIFLLGTSIATLAFGSEVASSRYLVWPLLLSPIVLISARHLLSKESRNSVDYFIRDTGVRLCTFLALFILLAVSTAIYPYLGILMLPFLFVPFAGFFVSILRLRAWGKAVPVVAKKELMSRFDGTGDSSFIPTTGLTNTGIIIERDVSVQFKGVFGYIPMPIEDLELRSITGALKMGLAELIFPAIYTVGFYAAILYREQQMVALLRTLPTEGVLVTTFSFFSIPQAGIKEALSFVGVTDAVLSAAFFGILVPALLLIPSVWHFTLAYERSQYRLLKRFGGQHHLGLLIFLHFLVLLGVSYLVTIS